MAYPKQPKLSDNSDLSPNPPGAPGVTAPIAPQTTSPMGGAPQVKTAPELGTPLTNRVLPGTRQAKGAAPISPSPFALKTVREGYADMVSKLQERIVQRAANPENQNSMFWKTVQQYPAQMAEMIVRRGLTNQLQYHAGRVGEWLDWTEGR